jgi:peptidoglycan hydrolase-like protein with peptidoglycan-binding domain
MKNKTTSILAMCSLLITGAAFAAGGAGGAAGAGGSGAASSAGSGSVGAMPAAPSVGSGTTNAQTVVPGPSDTATPSGTTNPSPTANSGNPTVTPTNPSANGTNTTAATPSASMEQITSAQRALSAGGFNVATDGVIGPKTTGAIQQYQSSHGLPQTGQLDAATMNELNLSGQQQPDSGSKATDTPPSM